MTDLREPMLEKYDPDAIEQGWYRRWEAAGLFHVEPDPKAEPFVIPMPPPNITGRAHMGHGSTYTAMDILVRAARMRGKNAVWLPGQDHAAIATQNVVEKDLAREGKTRHDLGRERFIERVWRWRAEYGDLIYRQFRVLGFGPDWQRDRFTMDEGLSRAVVKVFVALHREGLIYRGTRLVNWCPRCGSTLSDSEVEREEVRGTLYRVRYRGVDGADDVVIATTRPETIFADVAVAVHPSDARYRDLIGKRVMRPLLAAPIPVIADESVDPAFGTGALKITPGHDFTDYEIGQRHHLPEISVIGLDAKLMGAVEPEFVGLDRFAARDRAVEVLRSRGLLEGEEPHALSIGVCYRCETPVEPLLSLQWFVSMKPLAEPALRLAREGRPRFVPERFARIFEDWLENIRDWCVSRQIWWGHRLPVWYCANGHANVAETAVSACATCGNTELRQDEDTLDTWFSSGLWPFSILGWPDESPEYRAWYPAQVLVTSREIIFLWVARMVMMGLHFTGKLPFENVFIPPLILDEQGRKMSKSLGNSLDPLELVRDFGADATRFGTVGQMHAGQDVRYSIARCDDARKFCNKLWQAVRFALSTFPQLASPATMPRLPASKDLTLADRYVLDGLARTARAVTAAVDAYDLSAAAELLYGFIWNQLCDVYVEIAKDRAPSRAPVLAHVITDALKLLHPIMPFVTEELWQRLPHDGEFIGRSTWPGDRATWRDDGARDDMERVLEFIRAVRERRADARIPYRELRDVSVEGAPASLLALLRDQSGVVERLARAPKVVPVGNGHARPEHALSRRLGSMVIYLPVDAAFVQAERAALAKEIERRTNEAEAIERKLASAGFVKKAPPEIVAKERSRLVELRESVDSARSRLEML
jgi:valyl-tRNA synthetase